MHVYSAGLDVHAGGYRCSVVLLLQPNALAGGHGGEPL